MRPTDFGSFAIAYSVMAIAIGFARSVFGEGYLIAWASAGDGQSRQTWLNRGTVDAAVVAFLVTAVSIPVWSLAVDTGLKIGPLVLLVLGLVAALCHEVARYAAVQGGRPWLAAVSGLVRLVTLLLTVAAIDSRRRVAGALPEIGANQHWSLGDALVVWLLPAVVGSLPLSQGWRIWRHALAAKVHGRRAAIAVGSESLLALLATAAPTAVAGAAVSPSAAGTMRLVQSSLGPPSLLVDVARKRMTLRRAVSRELNAERASWAMFALATGAAVCMLLLPSLPIGLASGSQVVDSWRQLGVAGPLALAFVARAAGAAHFVRLRAAGEMRAVLSVRLAALVPTVLGIGASVLADSILPLTIGVALAAVLSNTLAVSAQRAIPGIGPHIPIPEHGLRVRRPIGSGRPRERRAARPRSDRRPGRIVE